MAQKRKIVIKDRLQSPIMIPQLYLQKRICTEKERQLMVGLLSWIHMPFFMFPEELRKPVRNGQQPWFTRDGPLLVHPYQRSK